LFWRLIAQRRLSGLAVELDFYLAQVAPHEPERYQIADHPYFDPFPKFRDAQITFEVVTIFTGGKQIILSVLPASRPGLSMVNGDVAGLRKYAAIPATAIAFFGRLAPLPFSWGSRHDAPACT
jgi:hypothetical protein